MKSIQFTLTLTALLAATHSAAQTSDSGDSIRKEKCYGISRAGTNDCSNATGTHQCAGYSNKDSDPAEWILMPKGTCEKIVGGSVKPNV